jgi:phage-related tail protein
MNSLMRNLGIPGFAEGVKGFGGGMAVVGENGPELVNLPRGADVIPNSVAFNNSASKGKELNQTIYITIDKVGGMQDVQALGRELGFRASMMP